MSDTSFYDGNSGGLVAEALIPESTDTGFFPSEGLPTAISVPFEGVLANSTAHIGTVTVANPTTHVAISNIPSVQDVRVINPVDVQRVELVNPTAIQDVRVTNPVTSQTVSGTVSVGNLPDVQKVVLTGPTTVLAGLTQGTEHVGRVSIDGPITGEVRLVNPVTSLSITNLPDVQKITGSVSVSNLPPAPTELKINNDTASPIPVAIVSGSAGGGTSNVTGNVTLRAGTAHIGSVAVDEPVSIAGTVPVSLTSVPTHSVTIAGTPSVNINGTVPVSLTSVPTHPVTLQGNATVQGTVTISNPVSISNPVTSVSIDNPISAPVPVSIQGGVSTFDGVLKEGTAHIGNVGIDGPLVVSLTSNSVSVSNPVRVDTSTPLRVEVTNPSSGGGGGTFDGNVVLQPGTAHIGRVSIDGPVTIASPLKIDDTDPVHTRANLRLVELVPPGPMPETVVVDMRGWDTYVFTLGVTTKDFEPYGADQTPLAEQFSGVVVAFIDQSADGEIWSLSTQPVLNTEEIGQGFEFSYSGAEDYARNFNEFGFFSRTQNFIRLRFDFSAVIDNKTGNFVTKPSDFPYEGFVRVRLEATGKSQVIGPVQSVLQTRLPGTGRAGRDAGIPQNPIWTSIANTVNVAGTVSATITNRPTVNINGTVPVSVASLPSHPVTIDGTPSVTVSNPVEAVSLKGADGTTLVSNTNAIPVTVVGGAAGGGSSFDGQLRQGGATVSATNPLPVVPPFVFTPEYASSVPSNQSVATPARANPGGGGLFVARFTSTTVVSSIRVEQSTDGSTWTTARTQANPAWSGTIMTIAVDAIHPFYRAVFQNSSLNQTAVTISSCYTPQTIDSVTNVVIGAGSSYIGSTSMQAGSHYNDTSTVLAANAVFTGSMRSSSNVPGGVMTNTTFSASVFADQGGTLRIEQCEANAPWYRGSADLVVPPGGGFVTISTPAFAMYHRVIFTNGGTAQTSFSLKSGYSRMGAI